jgi:transposase-like protein
MQSPSSLPGSWLAGDLSDDYTAVVHREMILFLKGISTGDFDEHLVALLGKDTSGLLASTFGRLKDAWSEKHVRWRRHDLFVKQYVYFWADGIHVQSRAC